eukprot:397284-Heterocapsa_arctica.AAC.1
MKKEKSISKSKSKAKIIMLGGTGASGRPLAITIRFLSNADPLFATFDPKRSNGSLNNIQSNTV